MFIVKKARTEMEASFHRLWYNDTESYRCGRLLRHIPDILLQNDNPGFLNSVCSETNFSGLQSRKGKYIHMN